MAAKQIKQARWQPVIVEWLDAQTHNGDYKFSEVKFEPPLRRTLGFLVVSTRAVVAVAGTDDRTSDLTCELADITVIPRGMVQRIIRLREDRRAVTKAA